MTRVKETEAVKAYITSQEDTYRQPYAKHVQTIPRRCVFIGTTNNPQFLTDRTGNRRFYPVNTDRDGYDMFDHEEEIMAYIEKCWAEAVYKFKHGDMKPYASRELIEIIREAQENAMEDDWRIGAIEQYLDDTKKKPNDFVSVIELWYNALGMQAESKPSRKDSIEISQIMTQIGGWIRAEKPIRTSWGLQKVFRKNQKFYPFWK
jgi:predicted P-loop ATPase